MKRKASAKLEKIRNLKEFQPIPKKKKVEAEIIINQEEIKEKVKKSIRNLEISQTSEIEQENTEKVKVSLENIDLIDKDKEYTNEKEEETIRKDDGFFIFTCFYFFIFSFLFC